MQWFGASYWGASYWSGITAYWANLNAVVTMINRTFRFSSVMHKSASFDSVMTKSLGKDSKMTKRISVITELSDVG